LLESFFNKELLFEVIDDRLVGLATPEGAFVEAVDDLFLAIFVLVICKVSFEVVTDSAFIS